MLVKMFSILVICTFSVVIAVLIAISRGGTTSRRLTQLIRNITNDTTSTGNTSSSSSTSSSNGNGTSSTALQRQRCRVGSQCQNDGQCTVGVCRDFGHNDLRCCPNTDARRDGCTGLGGGDSCKFDWQCSSGTCSGGSSVVVTGTCTGPARTLESSEFAVDCQFDSGESVLAMLMSELFPMIAGEVLERIIEGFGNRLISAFRNRLATRLARSSSRSAARIAQEISEMSIDEVCAQLDNLSNPRNSRIARSGSTLAKSSRSARTGVRMGSKLVRITGNAIKAGAMGLKMAAKASAKFLGKALLKFAGGPVGLALLAFEVTFLALDIYDVRNENQRATQEKTRQLRDQLEAFQWAMYTENGGDWPPTFEAQHIFLDEVSQAYTQIYDEFLMSYIQDKALNGTDSEKNEIARFLELVYDASGLTSQELQESETITERINESISDLMNRDQDRNDRLRFLVFNNLRERNRKAWNLARYAPWWYYASPSEVSLLNWDDIKVTDPQTKNGEVYIQILKRGVNSGYCERHNNQYSCENERAAACSYNLGECTSGGLYYEQHITAYQINPAQLNDCLVYKKGALFKKISPCACLCSAIPSTNCERYDANGQPNPNYNSCISQSQATAQQESCSTDAGHQCTQDSECSSGYCRDWGNFDKRCCPNSTGNRWDGCTGLSGGDTCKVNWQCDQGTCRSDNNTCNGSPRPVQNCTQCNRAGQDLTNLDFNTYFKRINSSRPEQTAMYKLKRDLPNNLANVCSQNLHAIFRCSGGIILQAVIRRKTLPVFPDAAEIVWGTQNPPSEPLEGNLSAAQYMADHAAWINSSRTFTNPNDNRHTIHIADTRGALHHPASNYNNVPQPRWWILEACYQRFLLELAVHPGICVSRSEIPPSAKQFGNETEDECYGEDSVWLRGVFIWKDNYYVAPLPRPWHDENNVTVASTTTNNEFSLYCTEQMCHKWNFLHMNLYKIGGVMDQIMPPDIYGKFVMPMVAIYSDKYPVVAQKNGNLFESDGSIKDFAMWNPQMQNATHYTKIPMLLNIADVFTTCIDGIQNGDSIYRLYPQWSRTTGQVHFDVDVNKRKDFAIPSGGPNPTIETGTGPATVESTNPWVVIDGISFDMDNRLCIYNPSGSQTCDQNTIYESTHNQHLYQHRCNDFCQKYRGGAFFYENGDMDAGGCSTTSFIPGQPRCDRGLRDDHTGIGDCRVSQTTEMLESIFSQTLVRSLS